MVDDHLQCSEELSNKDEFISRIATEKTKPTIVPDGEQEECVDNCNVKPTFKSCCFFNRIRYFETEAGTEIHLQNLIEMVNFIVKSSQIMSKQSKIISCLCINK